MDKIIERSNDLLSKQLAWVSAADSKVAPIFAINTAMLGVLAALIPPIANWRIFSAIITTLSVIPLIASIIFLALVTFPRLSGPKGSYIYFGGIITKNEDTYVNDMINIGDNVFLKDILTQTYRNAEIAQLKFKYIKKAMALTFISLPIWLLAADSLRLRSRGTTGLFVALVFVARLACDREWLITALVQRARKNAARSKNG